LTEGREFFNPLLHLVFPAVSTAAIGYLLYKTFNPYPPHPYNWALPVAGVWLAIGAILLAIMALRGKEEWLIKASESVGEIPIEEAGIAPRTGRSPEQEFFGTPTRSPAS
jgi:hypothetical protein